MKILNKNIYLYLLTLTSLIIINCQSIWAEEMLKEDNNTVWQLDSARSYLDFSSVKNSNIIEMHKFTDLSGKITNDNKAIINININSVATGLKIRDDRLKEFLFEAKKYPKAVFTANLDLEKILDNLKKDPIYKTYLEGYLLIKDHKVFLKMHIEVKYINPRTVKVMSLNPVVLNISDFHMQKGIEKLKELAGLNSIGFNIPVNFKVVFNRQA